jgi:hypothetical protein
MHISNDMLSRNPAIHLFNLSPEGVLRSATTPLSTSNTSLLRFLANVNKPKYARIKEAINFSCNNMCKYINTKTIPNLPVTQEALIYT